MSLDKQTSRVVAVGCTGWGIVVFVGAFVMTMNRRVNHPPSSAEATLNVRVLSDRAVDFFVASSSSPDDRYFPESAPLTPEQSRWSERCENGSLQPILAEQSDWERGGWTDLEFAFSDPMRFSYQFDSSGRGDNAHFTASAFGDLDCDGRILTVMRMGHVSNGEVVVEFVTVGDDR